MVRYGLVTAGAYMGAVGIRGSGHTEVRINPRTGGQEFSVQAFKGIGNALILCAEYGAVGQPVMIMSPAGIEPTFKV